MQNGLTVIALLLAVFAATDAPPAPVPALLPAPWACTAQTLWRGLPCTFEGTPGTSTATSQALVKELARNLCKAVADEDAAVFAACAARADAASSCVDVDVHAVVVDDDGRFVPGSGACYAAVRAVVVHAAAVKRDAASCCACVGNHDKCVADVDVDVRPAGANGEKCQSACAAVLLRAPEKPAAAPAPAPSSKK